ncbi:GNAT family N-acetyltransferase [Alteribacillus sp. JSM 102045]|uniref:GNAT family N-acetyltransferase n=1 Tax=Alteribacillus sp. JSM 102045 TaxID=1562101 RepID=UPI0035C24A2D
MVYELKRDEFIKCKPLLNNERHVEVKGVVDGVNRGRIFVDNPVLPNAGMIWLGNNDGFFFIGNPDNKDFNGRIGRYVEEVIKLQMLEQDLFHFEMIGNYPGWYPAIEKLFQHRTLSSWTQHVYILKKEQYEQERIILTTPYKIKKITKDFYFDKFNCINITYLHRKINESWFSAEDFFKQGIGYCIVLEDEIVGLCHTNFTTDNRQCIAIETSEAHQNQGLAKKMAHEFVQNTLKQGYTPYWDCMEENKPSQAVAKHIGFHHHFSYKGYVFSWAKE